MFPPLPRSACPGCRKNALDAYAAASPVTHTRHGAILAALIQRAQHDNRNTLMRLAVATDMDVAWTAVAQLLRANPRNAIHVVEAAPWDDLHADVQATMLSAANRQYVCAAIAFARGVRGDPTPITRETPVPSSSTSYQRSRTH
jgi:hypothetical protein